jgi:mannan endo-1,4-beta-mannosidase
VGGTTVLDETRRTERRPDSQPAAYPEPGGIRWWQPVAILGLLCLLVPGGWFIAHMRSFESRSRPQVDRPIALPALPASYLGLYADGVPDSYSAVTSFTKSTGVKPQLVMYFSGWFQQFSMSFAKAAAQHGAVPLVQINPAGISVGAISAGRYDSYLTAYAKAVRAYRLPVILSFGHEMNGAWYSWGYGHTPPKVFVAAWRHLVTLFREVGVRNVTWLWTINAFAASHDKIPSPAAWWPGDSYVTWVGIDGYYRKRSAEFVTLFGPTITAVRMLTKAPILIAETAAPRAVGQPASIADLFAGVKKYELLGFVWFDNEADRNYVMTGAAQAAMRRGASNYGKHAP